MAWQTRDRILAQIATGPALQVSSWLRVYPGTCELSDGSRRFLGPGELRGCRLAPEKKDGNETSQDGDP